MFAQQSKHFLRKFTRNLIHQLRKKCDIIQNLRNDRTICESLMKLNCLHTISTQFVNRRIEINKLELNICECFFLIFFNTL